MRRGRIGAVSLGGIELRRARRASPRGGVPRRDLSFSRGDFERSGGGARAGRTGDAVGGGDTPAGEERDERLANLVGVAHVAEGGVAVQVDLAVGGRGGGVGLDREASLGDGRLARDVRGKRVELLGADAADGRGVDGDGGGGADSEHCGRWKCA